MTITWNTGAAAERFRLKNKKKKNKGGPSLKASSPQARKRSSLTGPGIWDILGHVNKRS
jgi:hypothetical protein